MINVVYSSSEYYFKPSLVSIYSLLENTTSKIHIHFLSSKVSDENKSKLKLLVESYDAKLTIHEIDNELNEFARKLNLPLMRGGYSTYARILLADVLSDIDDIILIDSDTLILGDVSSMFSFIDSSKVMFAIRDYVISNINSNHEDKDLSCKPYFNMGVLYVSLNRWRSLGLSELLKKEFDVAKKLKIADQSIINRYLSTQIGALPISYNFYTYFHSEMKYEELRGLNNKTPFLAEEEFLESKHNPIILHFVGTWYERPWFKYNISSFSHIYLKYWLENFDKNDLFEKPPRKKMNIVYDTLSIFIFRLFGFSGYFFFRYNLVQKIKKYFL